MPAQAELDCKRRRICCWTPRLDNISRYESHLERDLFKVLHKTEQLQAARADRATFTDTLFTPDRTLSRSIE
jgi:hypothetical protein